jgi:hypothetical protein
VWSILNYAWQAENMINTSQQLIQQLQDMVPEATPDVVVTPTTTRKRRASKREGQQVWRLSSSSFTWS